MTKVKFGKVKCSYASNVLTHPVNTKAVLDQVQIMGGQESGA